VEQPTDPDNARLRPAPLRARSAARLGALCVIALGGTIACGDDGPAALTGVVRDPPLDVAAITLPSADGTEVAMRADPAELLVVYFGYTSCPDVCPTTMSDLSIAINDLSDEQADRATVAFTTVDPDRDTAEVVEGYLSHFFDDGLALRTEDADQLAAATEAFGVQFEVADHEPGDTSYDVAHTAVTYVVDDTGTVVVEWPFGSDPADMASDLENLLDTPQTPNP
jgi:protein SCO1